VISFLINYRKGDPAQVGYVTAGFWARITLGRILLVHPATKIGERTSNYALTIGAAALQLLVWLAPNVIGNAVAVSPSWASARTNLSMCNDHFQQAASP
jgi:fucose permease